MSFPIGRNARFCSGHYSGFRGDCARKLVMMHDILLMFCS